MGVNVDTMNVGSIEVISCLLVDRLGSIDTIPSADFKVVSEDEIDTAMDWTGAVNIAGMRVDCLVDSTGWSEGTYKLYVRASVPPEMPIIGPFEFGVS